MLGVFHSHRCVCGRGRVHAGRHFPRASLCHLSASSLPHLADLAPLLQDNSLHLGSVPHHHATYSRLPANFQPPFWRPQVRRGLGRRDAEEDLHDLPRPRSPRFASHHDAVRLRSDCCNALRRVT